MPPYTAIIVESPSKCSKIETYLGLGYKCMASYGHFRELSSLDKVDFSNGYTPQFSDSKSKRDKIMSLARFIRQAEDVMLATDDDREGEAIAWHICDRFGLDPETTPRIVFHEITKRALKDAVANPTLIDIDTVNAQKARQVLDLLVGFTISPLLWKEIECPRDCSLSAGRCQSPALRLVYDNQVDIDANPGESSYSTTAYFTSKGIDMPLSCAIATHELAMSFIKASVQHKHEHSLGKTTVSVKKAPLPFTTSLLQQKASSELRMSPVDTMAGCQALYEKGLITYHRTDMKVYAEEFVVSARQYIVANYGDGYARDIVGATQKDESAQAAHEAIRPTLVDNTEPAGLDNKQLKLYSLIHRNTVESCMRDAEYETFKWTVTAPTVDGIGKCYYRKQFEKQAFAGWQAVSKKDSTTEFYGYVRSLAPGVVDAKKIATSLTIKKLKQHLTEAKLVQALEKAGIGRPSTFSSLVDKIQTRKYVKKTNLPGRVVDCPSITLEDGQIRCTKTEKKFGEEKNKLVIQDLGKKVITFLIDNFDSVFKYSFTKELEDNLDKIGRAELTHSAVCSQCHESIKSVMVEKGLLAKVALRIDDEHSYIVGKFGPCIKRSKEGKTSFLPIKDGVTRERIVSERLSLEHIVGVKKTSQGEVLFSHQGHPVEKRNGRFGAYLRWRDMNYKYPSGLDGDALRERIITILSSECKLAADVWLKTNTKGPYIMKRDPKKPKAKPQFINLPPSLDPTDADAVRSWCRSKGIF